MNYQKLQLTTLDRQFIREIKDRNLWIKYQRAIHEQYHTDVLTRWHEQNREIRDIGNYISSMFLWSATREGGQFWGNVCREIRLKYGVKY